MPVVGIDLGTTYSAVAVLDEMKKPVVLPNSQSNNYTPSVVYFEDRDNIIVGELAKNSSEAYPDKVVQFVKNHIGFSGVGNTWEFDGETYGPEKVSAIILRKLKKDAEEAVGSEITGAVITVPAIFGEAQRTATREAAAIAGLEVINILDEPVAAALNYGLARCGSSRKAQTSWCTISAAGRSISLLCACPTTRSPCCTPAAIGGWAANFGMTSSCSMSQTHL